jgi:serine/threonine protein kinase
MQSHKGSPPNSADATTAHGRARQFEKKKDDSADPLVGAVMTGSKGAYTIVEPLDAGGMGKVYTALDGSGTTIVVKVISPDFAGSHQDENERHVRRFFQEARAAATVDHENVIRIIDVGTYKETVFCAMEYLKGMNLKEAARSSRPTWEWLAPILIDVCSGVQAAHDKRIIHRDMSPDNIFLAEVSGRRVVKVLDFGLAKFTDSEDRGLTQTGVAMGKITFMAPEQAEKAMGDRKDYDHRVDIYAIGVIMYLLLTGVTPFRGENDAQALFSRLKTTPARPRQINPAIPADVDAIIMKAMARKEEDRFQSASELRAAIAATIGQAVTPSPQVPGMPGSNDMYLRDVLRTMEGSGGVAPQAGLRQDAIADGHAGIPAPQAAMPPMPAAGTPSYMPGRRQEARKSAFGRVVGWSLALAIAAGAAVGYKVYEPEIQKYIQDVKARAASSAAGPDSQESAKPPASQQPAPEGFLASLESTPAGATVYELKNGKKEYIGATPLTRRLPDGEHELMFYKRGFAPKRVKVSGAQSAPHVTLLRQGGGKPRAAAGPLELEEIDVGKDEGTEEDGQTQE